MEKDGLDAPVDFSKARFSIDFLLEKKTYEEPTSSGGNAASQNHAQDERETSRSRTGKAHACADGTFVGVRRVSM